MSARVEISVVVPMYCEAQAVAPLCAQLDATLASVARDYEIVAIDDGSPDGTWMELQQAAERYPRLRAYRLSRNFGKEHALCAGLDRARGEAVITMDADLEHPTSLIPLMVREWRSTGANVVEAVRAGPTGRGWRYRLSSRAFYWLMRLLTGYELEGMTDFKLLDRQVLEAWLKLGEHNLFYRGMIRWLGFRCRQVSFTAPESHRSTRWSFAGLVRLGATGITSFTSTPLYLLSLLGFACLVPAGLLLVWTLYQKFAGQAVSGFATVISLQLILGGLQMLGLGVIGAYIGRIHEEVKHRPRYLVAESLEPGSR